MHEYDPEILDILKEGNFTKVRQLFVITDNNIELMYQKFELWCFVFTPAVFKKEEAEFHREIKQNLCDLYLGKIMSLTEIAFRGASKTTYAKLFVAFVLANDQRASRRKYFKIVSEDPINSTQFSTDVYNILVGKKIKYYYPHLFQKTDLKREETKSSFTLTDGRKVLASTVDKGQRGHLQGEEASRPDFVIFEDFETSDTIQSLVISEDIWRTMEEAWNGRSMDGVALYNCNYISKRRNVQRILDRAKRSPEAHRIHKVPILINGKSAWPTAFTVEQIRQIERDSTDFMGEYMCNPSGAVDSFFSEQFLSLHPTMPVLAQNGSWSYFYKLDKSHQYILGVDPAGGNGGDYATIVVIDWTIRTVVAYFQDKWTNPEKLGDEASNKGTLFNNALVIVERNNHGHAVLLQMKHNKYSNLYEEIDESEHVENYTEKLGFTTTNKSKPAILSALSSAINNFNIVIPVEKIKNEMINFPREYVEAKMVDPDLGHFDLTLACFIRGTKILTDKGQINIEKLKIGDLVMTRAGYKPVIGKMVTLKKVIKNIGLTGTYDHPIFYGDNEIKNLLSITKADILYIWDSKQQKIERLSYIKARYIIDTPIHHLEIIEYILKVVQNGKSKLNIYIEKYGKIILVKYLKDLLFIIKMITLLTIVLIIWRYYHVKNMLNYTCLKREEKKLQEKHSKNIAIRSIKELLSIIKIKNQQKRTVLSVEFCMELLSTIQNTALRNVLKDFLVRKENFQQENMYVKSVQNHLKHINQTKKDALLSVSKEEEEYQQVFNIQVGEQPEYFANNILVHNCALAYQGRFQLTGKLSTTKYA